MYGTDPLQLVGTILRKRYRVLACTSQTPTEVLYRAEVVDTGASVGLRGFFAGSANEAVRERTEQHFRYVGRWLRESSSVHRALVLTHAVGWVSDPRDGARVPVHVQEWLNGESLATTLARERGVMVRMPAAVLEQLRGVLDAVSDAHRHGIVHGALDPSVIVRESSRLVVLGFARAMATAVGAAWASRDPLYNSSFRAPEQRRGAHHLVGPWTDVYALGALAVELLTGRAAHGVAYGQAPTPRQLGVHVPGAIETVFERALALDPSRRFRDAPQLLKAFESAVVEGRLSSSGVSRVQGELVMDTTPIAMRRGHDSKTTLYNVLQGRPARRGEVLIANRPT